MACSPTKLTCAESVQHGYGVSYMHAGSQGSYTNGGQPPAGRPMNRGPMHEGGIPPGVVSDHLPRHGAAYATGTAPADAPLATADLLHPYGATVPHGHMHGVPMNGGGAAMHAPQGMDSMGLMSGGTPLPSGSLRHAPPAAHRPQD